MCVRAGCCGLVLENGTELMRTNFGISYNNGMNTFQPDFIVRFKNGTVGIFDTKPNGNINLADTTLKQEALYNYIQKINYNRGYAPKVVGGMVIQSGTQFYLFQGKEYHDYTSNSEGWINFNELIRELTKEYDIAGQLKAWEEKMNKK